MKNKLEKLYEEMKAKGLTDEQEKIILHELNFMPAPPQPDRQGADSPPNLYDWSDLEVLHDIRPYLSPAAQLLKTLDELLDKDKQREKDGFPKRIRLGKIMKPGKNDKNQVIVVPTTSEPKFYHDNSVTEEQETGGSGEGDEGEVIGEQPARPQQGEGQGAGQGNEGNHDVASDAYDLGKTLTEKFQLPNLKDKGKKRSFSKYIYDLTDRNRGFGQFLDKKETLKRIVKTNILLGNIDPGEQVSTEDLIINPRDHVYQILSREKDFETQAVVFFVRDYSGSMQGKPTQVVCTQHLFIYSWLMYQYSNNVMSRFVLHDNNAKEVPDFYTYYNSQVAGGTNIHTAYDMVNKIIEEEQLARDYNIYVFHGTDGDDWESDGKKALEGLRKMMQYTNRIGITVAKNSWGGTSSQTTVEKYIEKSGLLKDKSQEIRLDSMEAESVDETRIIEGIKKLMD